jgi:hypothetical protein
MEHSCGASTIFTHGDIIGICYRNLAFTRNGHILGTCDEWYYLVIDKDELVACGGVAAGILRSVGPGDRISLSTGLIADDIPQVGDCHAAVTVIACSDAGHIRNGHLIGTGYGYISGTGDGRWCLIIDGDGLCAGG